MTGKTSSPDPWSTKHSIPYNVENNVKTTTTTKTFQGQNYVLNIVEESFGKGALNLDYLSPLFTLCPQS